MSDLLKNAVASATEAGQFIYAASSDLVKLNIEQKKQYDYVSEVDRNSESIIRDHIQSVFPDHAFWGEEFGYGGDENSDYVWVVDPLDGTTNFLRGLPHYAVSIAVLEKRQVVCAVVYDPAKNEMFSAVKGGGAYLNDKQITVSARESNDGALIATGIPFNGESLGELDAFQATMTSILNSGTSGIRRFGSAALDLAYVAAGRYDGFWEARLKPWDIAAGALLVSEAGGKVSDFNGQQSFLESGDIVATNQMIYSLVQNQCNKQYSR